MATELLMPAAAAGVEQATLVRWRKQPGDAVRKGEVLAEVETDKAVMEIEAEADATVGRLLVAAGTENVAVGAPIAVLLAPGETYDAAAAMPSSTDRVAASPFARRAAQEQGVALATVAGSGPGGRIVGVDIERAAAPGATSAAAGFTPVAHTAMRKTIARRLTEAKQQVPHYYLETECRVEALLGTRATLNGRPGATRLSVNDFVVAAAARALAAVAEVNASWTDAAIQRWTQVNVSVAVATDAGLITPIVRGADRLPLDRLAAEIRELSVRAREGRLGPAEYQGSGITVSNLGMYGITRFAAVINPPQSAILAVGAVEARAVVDGDRVVPGRMMSVTLSADHRVIDGALGARYLQELRRLLEGPVLLVA